MSVPRHKRPRLFYAPHSRRSLSSPSSGSGPAARMLSLQASPRVHYAAWDCTLGGNRTRMAVRRQILTSAVYTNFTTGAERRGWDSNPCGVAAKRFSRPPRYDRFDTSPYQASSFVRTRLQRGLPNAPHDYTQRCHRAPVRRHHSKHRAAFDETRTHICTQNRFSQLNYESILSPLVSGQADSLD